MKYSDAVKFTRFNSGAHFLDSGGDSGRAWQRNQGHDFEQDDRIEFNFYDGKLEYVTVSLYHYLLEVLETDDLSEDINSILSTQRVAGDEAHWVQECMEIVEDNFSIENSQGPYNTYNGENNTSQVFQFMTFTVNDEAYVLLQIHGGADVRGGYTNTQCFKLIGYLTGNVDVHGSVNDVDITNTYNSYSLTTDDGEEIEIKETDEIGLDFSVMDDTYMYTDI